MNNIVDLDLIGRATVKVKLNEKVFEVHPPSLKDLIRVGKLGVELETNPNTETLDEIKAAIDSLVPGIIQEDINMAQLMALIDVISKLAVPEDTKALNEKQLGPDTLKKKPEEIPTT